MSNFRPNYGLNKNFRPTSSITFVYSSNPVIGYCLEGGQNCTGMIGMMQRDEIDVASQYARPGVLADGVVTVGAAVMPVDLIVISRKARSVRHALDVLDIVEAFDTLSGLGMITLLLWIIIVISFGTVLLRRRKVNEANYSANYYFVKVYQTTWRVVELLLDQENFAHSYSFANFIWLILCIFLLVVIFGHLLNLMSTDMVAHKPGENINELRDLIRGGAFTHSQPVMLKLLYFYDYLLKSKPGTDIHQLYRKMADFEDCRQISTCSFLDIDFSKTETMVTILEYMMFIMSDLTRSRCILINRQYLESATEKLACMYNPSLMLKAHVSNQAIVSDILVLFYNRHRTTWMLRERVDYTTMSRLEFGYIPNTMSELAMAVAAQASLVYDWKAQKCVAKIEDDQVTDESQPLWWLRKTGIVCITLLVIGTVCLMIEIISYRYYRYRVRNSLRLFSEPNSKVVLTKRSVAPNSKKLMSS